MHAKPIDTLTDEDLRTHPIWEWAHDEEDGDETHVRPVELSVVPGDGEFHVACSVVTAQARVLSGLLSVVDGRVDDGNGIVVVGVLGHYFPLDVPPGGRKEKTAFQDLFGASYNDVFPVSWEASVPIEGHATTLTGSVSAPKGKIGWQ